MNKIFKIFLICCVCFNSPQVLAQINEYIASETSRIDAAERTEVEIQNFIHANFNKYKLSDEMNVQVIQHLKNEDAFTDAELENALIEAKKHELRKLFFVENPELKNNYVAKPIPVSIMQQCVNGDFENGTAGYSFWTDSHAQPSSGSAFFLSCATPTVLTATNVVTPATNNFNANITKIDNTSPGYQQFDPALASFGVNIPTLPSNGGNKCIKLNNAGGMGSSDLSSVSRYFPNINQSTIDFNFSLIMDNKPAHGQEIQPFFRVRVLDQFNNVVDEICIIANPDNCLFNRIDVAPDRRILYTGWICARLNVEDILNQPGTIEFSVSDCQPSKHFGTVYIDNICGTICATPQLGALSLDPANLNCPDTLGNTPFQVCGTYQPPVSATLNTISLDITQNGVVIGTINAPTQITANTFCFTVLPSIFGADPSGDYEFDIHATFNVNCPPGTFIYDIYDHSANLGPDVTFDNCCQATLILTSPNDDHNNLAVPSVKIRERSNWIKAANVIQVGNTTIGNGVVYHAENYVELIPGFEALSGAQFAAYPEGCSGTSLYKNQDGSKTLKEIINLAPQEDDSVKLVKTTLGFAIVPNPSTSVIEISMKHSEFNRVTITTIDGKIVSEHQMEWTNAAQLDVSRFAHGVYIVSIVTNDGQLLTEKLIKN